MILFLLDEVSKSTRGSRMNILIKQRASHESFFLNTGILPAEWNDRGGSPELHY